jgi:hypothetical protein
MNETHSALAAFHLTGERSGPELDDVGRLGLRPALFSAYRDLSTLRHDFPVVFAEDEAAGGFVHSLSRIVDGVLQEIAPRGIEGERIRKHVLGLEKEIRTLASQGRTGTLSQLWKLAEAKLVAGSADDDARNALNDSLARARAALALDGEVADCDERLPSAFVSHAWNAVQRGKAREFRSRIGDLILKLSDIVKADSLATGNAQGAESLKHSVGPRYESVFDFEAMSRMLRTTSPAGAMPRQRRTRVVAALSTLKSQKFFAPTNDPADDPARGNRHQEVHSFVFDRCAAAVEAFRERLPEMVEFIKALTIAELEVEGRYRESKHDPFFRGFDARYLGPDEMALFPSYLVCLGAGVDGAEEMATLIDILCSDLPIKVLVQSDDILDDASIWPERLPLASKGTQIAAMALGLNNPFVMQSTGSCLYPLRDSVLKGLADRGPALFSVYSGSTGDAAESTRNAPTVAPYLRAASATESRAFPAFTYDPASGSDWASRFSVDGNPQVDTEWPVHGFAFEDPELQRASQDTAFTFADFVACDRRHASHFARVPTPATDNGMVPVNEFLELEGAAAGDKVPYILMVDESNALHRAVVDDTVIGAARRCRESWRNLQELGGINNSHARNLLAKEKEIWEQEKAREIEELERRPAQKTEQVADTVAAPAQEQVAAEAPEAAAPAVAEVAEEAAEAPVDEPYIETPRCTTCNECTEINNKMFAYDENMQAYVADPDAGTYRQLVDAAELCQVCIIHPGKPRNANESGLAELVERAEPFN